MVNFGDSLVEADKENAPITRVDIAFLFKDKGDFDNREEIIDIIYNGVKEPSLMCFDYADLLNIIKPNRKFELIKTFLDKISGYQATIDASAGTIVVFTCGPKDTLGFVNAIIEDNFSKTGGLVTIAFIKPEAPSGNPKLDIILARK